MSTDRVSSKKFGRLNGMLIYTKKKSIKGH